VKMDDLGANNRNGTTIDRTNFEDAPVSLERTLYSQPTGWDQNIRKENAELRARRRSKRKAARRKPALRSCFSGNQRQIYPYSYPVQ